MYVCVRRGGVLLRVRHTQKFLKTVLGTIWCWEDPRAPAGKAWLPFCCLWKAQPCFSWPLPGPCWTLFMGMAVALCASCSSSISLPGCRPNSQRSSRASPPPTTTLVSLLDRAMPGDCSSYPCWPLRVGYQSSGQGPPPLLCRDMALQNSLYTGNLARLQEIFPPHSTAHLLLESRVAEPRWESCQRGEGCWGGHWGP